MIRKTFILFVLFFAIVTQSYAQRLFATDRGSLLLGGNISLSSSGGDSYSGRTFDFNFNPDFEIFVAPSFSIGAEVLFAYHSYSESTSSNIGVGPSLTYFIAGHKEKKVYPYIGLSYLVSVSTSNSTDNGSINGASKAKAGLMIMLSDAVALNTEFYYYSGTYDFSDNPRTNNRFYLGLGIKAFIF